MRIHNWALVGALAFLAACQPSSRQDGNEGEGVGDVVPAGEEPALAADEAWVLGVLVGLSGPDGGAGSIEVIQGTKVKVLETANDLVRVQAPEGSGWLKPTLIAVGMRRGVLTEAAEGLAKTTFVGYAPLEGDDSRVTVYAAGTNGSDPVRTVVDKSIVSYSRDDINLAVQWHLAEHEPDAQTKADRLNKALISYAASRFAPQVQEAIETLVGKSDVTAEEFSQIATVQGAAEVYSAPHGSVVGQLAAGEQVQTVERTGEDTFNGGQDRWYKLADPAGWVFGTSLTF